MRTIELHLKFRIFVMIISIVKFAKESLAVVPDYCLYNLNISDCKMKPTPVFFYYKPGSRCEMAMWRGCPTRNLFKDQYLCTNMCIFKFLNKKVEDNTIVPYIPSKTTVKYSCEDTFDENRCSNEKRRVYTYNIGLDTCIVATWRGCPTANRFPDLSSCQEHCMHDHHVNYDEWKDELEAISENDVNTINQILDELSSKEMADDNVKLKGNNKPIKSTTPFATKTTTVSTTETTTVSTTESTTSSTTASMAPSTAASTTFSTPSTTESPTVSTTERTIPSTTPSTTSSTTASTTSSSTARTISSTTESTTPSTTASTTPSTTESTTPSTTESTTPSTTASTTSSTTASTTSSTTASTTSSTTESTTPSTTASTTPSTTESTTPSTTTRTTVSTPESTTPATIKVTTDSKELPEETQLLDYD